MGVRGIMGLAPSASAHPSFEVWCKMGRMESGISTSSLFWLPMNYYPVMLSSALALASHPYGKIILQKCSQPDIWRENGRGKWRKG